MHLGNACYHSVQNHLLCRLLPKNVKIKIHRTTTLLFYMGVKPGFSKGRTLAEGV